MFSKSGTDDLKAGDHSTAGLSVTSELLTGETLSASASGQGQLKTRLLRAQRITASLGQIVALMAQCEPHSRLPIGEIRWLVAPAVQSGQFIVAGRRLKERGVVVPAAALLWASVSDSVDERLADGSQSSRLQPLEWNSGSNLWLVEAIGDPSLVSQLMHQLGTTKWNGRVIKVRTRQSDGSIGVRSLGPFQKS